MSGKCFATVRSRKCKSVVLFIDLVSTSWEVGSQKSGFLRERLGNLLY